MKNGYDQFFKNARKTKTPASLNKANSANRRSTSNDELKQKISDHLAEAKIKKSLNVKKAKNKSHPILIFSIFGFIVCLFGFLFHEEVEKFVDKVEINFLEEVQAKDTTSAPKEKPDVDSSKEVHKQDEEKKVEIADDEHFLKLQSRKDELDQREEELKRKEQAITEKEVALELRLKELEEMRSKISSILEERTKTDEKKLETLVQVYTSMKPPQAAKVFETLDEDLAVELLGRMKKKSAADIMNLLKPEKAQLFSERIAGYRLPASK